MKTAIVVALLLAAMTALRAAENATVSISISVPSERNGERGVQYWDRTSHFHVIVSNISDQPQRIWQERFSWGYSALSFEFSDESGKKWAVKKRGMKPFTMNRPAYWLLDPHESLVYEVYFADTGTWEGFPVLEPGGSRVVSVLAVFEIRSTPESLAHGAWTGRVVSKPSQIRFWKPEP